MGKKKYYRPKTKIKKSLSCYYVYNNIFLKNQIQNHLRYAGHKKMPTVAEICFCNIHEPYNVRRRKILSHKKYIFPIF